MVCGVLARRRGDDGDCSEPNVGIDATDGNAAGACGVGAEETKRESNNITNDFDRIELNRIKRILGGVQLVDDDLSECVGDDELVDTDVTALDTLLVVAVLKRHILSLLRKTYIAARRSHRCLACASAIGDACGVASRRVRCHPTTSSLSSLWL